jgi:cytochrome c-type biogenesis protein CcmH
MMMAAMRHRLLAFVLSIGLVVAAGPLAALQPDEILPDPALEARARALSAELRCAVCQNQSIDDSNAPLARDLRLLVRERLVKGDSDEEVIDFIVARYGEYVLLRPTFAPHNYILWAAPALMLMLAIWLSWRLFARGRRKPEPAEAALTEAEKARLKDLLG